MGRRKIEVVIGSTPHVVYQNNVQIGPPGPPGPQGAGGGATDQTVAPLVTTEGTQTRQAVQQVAAAAASGKQNNIPVSTTDKYYRGDKTWATLDKAAVGLPLVDNTPDNAKPLSGPQQIALNGKQDAGYEGMLPGQPIYMKYDPDTGWPARLSSRTDLHGVWIDDGTATAEPPIVTPPAVNGAYNGDQWVSTL